MIRAEQRIGDTTSLETRYYISSSENDARLALQPHAAQWGIEHGLHWVLDITSREGESCVRRLTRPKTS